MLVLSDADQSNARIASGVNNAVARVAGLLAIAAVGAVISVQFSSSLDQRLAGARLSPAQRTIVTQAHLQTLTHVDPSRGGSRLSLAVQSASVDAFRRHWDRRRIGPISDIRLKPEVGRFGRQLRHAPDPFRFRKTRF